jgi:hypothetical protein
MREIEECEFLFVNIFISLFCKKILRCFHGQKMLRVYVIIVVTSLGHIWMNITTPLASSSVSCFRAVKPIGFTLPEFCSLFVRDVLS